MAGTQQAARETLESLQGLRLSGGSSSFLDRSLLFGFVVCSLPLGLLGKDKTTSALKKKTPIPSFFLVLSVVSLFRVVRLSVENKRRSRCLALPAVFVVGFPLPLLIYLCFIDHRFFSFVAQGQGVPRAALAPWLRAARSPVLAAAAAHTCTWEGGASAASAAMGKGSNSTRGPV